MRKFVKKRPGAPSAFFLAEAAGLRWLGDVDGGAPCVEVLDVDDSSLTLVRLEAADPTADAAREFGRRLATTHGAGAAGFGAAPDGWRGPGFFGPMAQPLPMSLNVHESWGEFYAVERLLPFAEMAGRRLGDDARRAIDDVAAACAAGEFDTGCRPARIHGDLWNGNLIWTRDGAVMIDPAAHGGHPETDIAMLALFGCPFFPEIVQGYDQVKSLTPGWRQRAGLHQLFPQLAHVVLFGGSYSNQVEVAAHGVRRV